MGTGAVVGSWGRVRVRDWYMDLGEETAEEGMKVTGIVELTVLDMRMDEWRGNEVSTGVKMERSVSGSVFEGKRLEGKGKSSPPF